MLAHTTMARRPLTPQEEFWRENLRRIYDQKKKSLGLTQEKLAEKCGWKSQGSVGQYFLGRIPLNTDAKIKLANALEIPVTDIDPEMKSTRMSEYSAGAFMEIHRGDLEKMTEEDLLELAGMIKFYVKEVKNKD